MEDKGTFIIGSEIIPDFTLRKNNKMHGIIDAISELIENKEQLDKIIKASSVMKEGEKFIVIPNDCYSCS